MKEKIRQEIALILKKSIEDIKKRDLASLREQSDKIIEKSSIYQDKDSISLAVIIYSIFKILEKKDYTKHEKWDKFKKLLIINLNAALKSIEKGDIANYSQNIKKILQDIKEIEKDVGPFIEHVINSTKIKKASAIYEQGVSAGRVAEMLGISRWELMPYLGQTKEPAETPLNISKSIAERIAYTKKIFNLK